MSSHPTSKSDCTPHVIRLRRPWQKQIQGNPNPLRIDVPEELSDETEVAEASYHRSFNSPTGLEDSTRVFLVIESWHGNLIEVVLNDQLIEPANRIEITSWIRSHNSLALRIAPTDEQPPRLSGGVHLEIIEPVR